MKFWRCSKAWGGAAAGGDDDDKDKKKDGEEGWCIICLEYLCDDAQNTGHVSVSVGFPMFDICAHVP